MRNIIIFSSRLFRVQQMTYWCSTLRGGCIGEYCHHSEELTGNIGWSLERSDGGGQYCTSILRNDDSIHRYIWPRTTVFTLLSCQLLSMCHFSTVYPPTYFPIRRGVHSTKIDFSTMYPPTHWIIRGGVDSAKMKHGEKLTW